ncbi:WxcM-like domain-containing protein [Opitutales bacterium]|nr:WxcM-like domain-containing protein [Opitutales bacterium]MDC0363441.1 WxcM-like domain-containing protein [Opitutales bacterium]
MKVIQIKTTHQDERGEIKDIIEQIDFNGATIIESKKGSIRGNHYHKKTIQYIFVLSGKLKAKSKKVDESMVEVVVEPGDLISHEQLEAHCFEAIEDSLFLVLSSGLRTGKDYEKDTYRLNVPLEEFSKTDLK